MTVDGSSLTFGTMSPDRLSPDDRQLHDLVVEALNDAGRAIDIGRRITTGELLVPAAIRRLLLDIAAMADEGEPR